MRDKILMNRTLDKLKIPHPKTYYYPFKKMPYTSEECVIKYRYGQRGNTLRFVKFEDIDIEYLTPDEYVQTFIPFEKEYRVGVDFLRMLGIREKVDVGKIRNSRTCTYITRHIDKLEEFAWDTFKKFKIDFTGIDIGLWEGKYIVIEFNSAPTIGQAWTRKLGNDLIKLLYDKELQKRIIKRCK